MNPREASEYMARFISSLSATDRQSLAGYLGVTVREAERWGTSAGESRNFIPSRFWGSDPSNLPGDMKQRFNVAAILRGLSGHIAGAGKTGSYIAGSASLGTALLLAERYRMGEMGSPFKDNTTVSIDLTGGGGEWTVNIGYEVSYHAGEFADRDWDDDFLEDADGFEGSQDYPFEDEGDDIF